MAVLRVSHIGICVTDLERSLAFYRDLLGFEERGRGPFAGDQVDRLLDLDGVQLEAVWIERDGTRLELLYFGAPAADESESGNRGSGRPRAMNLRGFTHLSMRVDDLEALLGKLRAAGVTVLDESRVGYPEHGIAAAFVVDPDGTRVELVQMPGDPASLPVG